MSDEVKAPETPDVSVSIVSFNTVSLLRNCLNSLLARESEGEAKLEIIVADNGSSDGSQEMVRSEFPTVRLIDTGGNIGYGRANNLALKKARGKYYFILNSDTEVEPGAIKSLLSFMNRNPRIGVVGGQLILPDKSIQGSCSRDPTLAGIFWEQTYLDKLFPNNKVTANYSYSGWDHKSIREVQQICGACLFIRGVAFLQIGGFDPAYFMYFEDTDLCMRLRKEGWPIFFLPDAKIQHHLGASSSKSWQLRAMMISSYNQSRYYYYRRNLGVKQGKRVKALTVFGSLLRLVVWSVIALFRPSARDQVKLFLSVFMKTISMTDVSPAHLELETL